jgi:hypothetical protein
LDIFLSQKKKKVKTIFYLLSGVLYKPYLLLDAPVNAFFASFPSGVVKTGNAVSDEGDDGNADAIAVAVEPAGQKGRPTDRIHKRESGLLCRKFLPQRLYPRHFGPRLQGDS